MKSKTIMKRYFFSRAMRYLSSFCALVIIFLLSGCDTLKPDSKGDSVPEGAVDLGLSVKWASCNLGASSPEEYGEYFAWGEINPKLAYESSNYLFSTGPKYGLFSKYNGGTDPKSVLDLSDDAAHEWLGKKWRIPTNEEWLELYFNCKKEKTTINGVSGIKFSSDTGEWIFLPAAGHYEGPDLLSDGGFYWSSNVVENRGYLARAFSFKSPNLYFGKDEIWRFLGLSIRPVSD